MIALKHKFIELCVLLKRSLEVSSVVLPLFVVCGGVSKMQFVRQIYYALQWAEIASHYRCSIRYIPCKNSHAHFKPSFFSWQNCVFFKCTRRLEYYLNWRCGAIDQHGHITDDMIFGKAETIAIHLDLYLAKMLIRSFWFRFSCRMMWARLLLNIWIVHPTRR